jgi:hypothetical protein
MTENTIHRMNNNCIGCNCWISVSDTKNSYVIFADSKTEETLYGFNWMCISCWTNNWVIEFPYFKTLIHNAAKNLWREEHKV